jgi:hypothetical protein
LQTSILLSLLEKLACARPFDNRYMTHEVLPPYYIKVAPGAKDKDKMVFEADFVVLSGEKKAPRKVESWGEEAAKRKMGNDQVEVNITPYAKGGRLPEACSTHKVKKAVLDYVFALHYSPEALAESDTASYGPSSSEAPSEIDSNTLSS